MVTGDDAEEDELRALKDLASGPVSDALHYVLQDMELQRSRIDSFTHEQPQTSFRASLAAPLC